MRMSARCGNSCASRCRTASTSKSCCAREGLPRPEVRPLNRQERQDIRREEDESRGDRRGGEGREDQDNRSEPHDRREADGPRPQLTSEDPEARRESDDRGVPAEERMAVHEVEVSPEDRGEDGDDPRRGGDDRRPRAALRRGRDDREDRRDEPREPADPPGSAGQPSESRGAREERKSIGRSPALQAGSPGFKSQPVHALLDWNRWMQSCDERALPVLPYRGAPYPRALLNIH